MRKTMTHTRRTLVALAATGTATALLTGPAAPDASAAGGYGCSVLMGTHWAGNGSATWTWVGRNTVNPVTFSVTDTRADRHAVGARLVTVRRDDSTHYWPWKVNHSGNGKTNEFGTHATDSGGIKGARIQVAVLEGGSVLGSCDTPYTKNPRS